MKVLSRTLGSETSNFLIGIEANAINLRSCSKSHSRDGRHRVARSPLSFQSPNPIIRSLYVVSAYCESRIGTTYP
jgi:hypothetical protein